MIAILIRDYWFPILTEKRTSKKIRERTFKKNNMYNYSLEDLRQRFENIVSKAEDIGLDFEEEVCKLEEDIDVEIEILENNWENENKEVENELNGLNELKKELKKFKTDNDFYDEEGELDMMFPDRHDDDFDEDSISL